MMILIEKQKNKKPLRSRATCRVVARRAKPEAGGEEKKNAEGGNEEIEFLAIPLMNNTKKESYHDQTHL
jgi:hypothetical protein